MLLTAETNREFILSRLQSVRQLIEPMRKLARSQAKAGLADPIDYLTEAYEQEVDLEKALELIDSDRVRPVQLPANLPTCSKFENDGGTFTIAGGNEIIGVPEVVATRLPIRFVFSNYPHYVLRARAVIGKRAALLETKLPELPPALRQLVEQSLPLIGAGNLWIIYNPDWQERKVNWLLPFTSRLVRLRKPQRVERTLSIIIKRADLFFEVVGAHD